ncbi:hypothetical protein MHBO_000993 [Bonamia ostreae]|uniref:Uncharacterized protein n=1 Tax=Bonamia ostreae TaxID=126728 RepID=A0ABV2AHH2_9EUKA
MYTFIYALVFLDFATSIHPKVCMPYITLDGRNTYNPVLCVPGNKECLEKCLPCYSRQKGDNEHKCDFSTGEWSGEPLACQREVCGDLPDNDTFRNMKMNDSNCAWNGNCTVSCEDNFEETNTNRKIVCRENIDEKNVCTPTWKFEYSKLEKNLVCG